MKAHGDKSEKKTLFGGTRYVLNARIELTPEESKALAGFRTKDAGIFAPDADTDRMTRILEPGKLGKAFLASQYIKGVTLVFNSVEDITFFENEFYRGCKNLKEVLEAHAADRADIGTSRSFEF